MKVKGQPDDLDTLAGYARHCLAEREGLSRDEVGEAVLTIGLARAAKPLRVLLGEILKGRE